MLERPADPNCVLPDLRDSHFVLSDAAAPSLFCRTVFLVMSGPVSLHSREDSDCRLPSLPVLPARTLRGVCGHSSAGVVFRVCSQ